MQAGHKDTATCLRQQVGALRAKIASLDSLNAQQEQQHEQKLKLAKELARYKLFGLQSAQQQGQGASIQRPNDATNTGKAPLSRALSMLSNVLRVTSPSASSSRHRHASPAQLGPSAPDTSPLPPPPTPSHPLLADPLLALRHSGTPPGGHKVDSMRQQNEQLSTMLASLSPPKDAHGTRALQHTGVAGSAPVPSQTQPHTQAHPEECRRAEQGQLQQLQQLHHLRRAATTDAAVKIATEPPASLVRSPIFHQQSPTFHQKSPVLYQKSPSFYQKSPMIGTSPGRVRAAAGVF